MGVPPPFPSPHIPNQTKLIFGGDFGGEGPKPLLRPPQISGGAGWGRGSGTGAEEALPGGGAVRGVGEGREGHPLLLLPLPLLFFLLLLPLPLLGGGAEQGRLWGVGEGPSGPPDPNLGPSPHPKISPEPPNLGPSLTQNWAPPPKFGPLPPKFGSITSHFGPSPPPGQNFGVFWGSCPSPTWAGLGGSHIFGLFGIFGGG